MIENVNVSYPNFGLMNHRGDKLRQAIDSSGLSKAQVARKLGIGRTTMYYKLEKPDLEYDFIIEVYKALKKDVLNDFPELSNFIAPPLEAQEPVPVYQSKLDDCLGEVDKWKTKYIELMEEYNHLLKENRALQARQTG